MEADSVLTSQTEMTNCVAASSSKPESKKRRDRGEGGLFKRPGSKNWYVSYQDLNGKSHIESSRTKKKSEAQTILTSRLETVRKGEMVDVRKLRYEDIRAILVADYRSSGKLIEQTGDDVVAGRKGLFKPLDEFFRGMPIFSITTDVIRRFVAERKKPKFVVGREKKGVSAPTCNRNLALLRRMFTIAKREGKIRNVPYFPMEKESPAREGFVRRPEFEKIREAMPENLHPFLTFLYDTGCRTGAAKQIVWQWVKLHEGIVELPAGVIKNRKALRLPVSAELAGMLGKMFQTTSQPVFDATNFRKEWNKACVKVGLGKLTGKKWYQYAGLTPHDFRRSAVSNMRRAGVDQVTAMSISGHSTISVFQRYNIVDDDDKKAAMKEVEEAAMREIGRR